MQTKPRIFICKSIVGEVYYCVAFNGNVTNYSSLKAAGNSALKISKRFYKEHAAFAMLQTISINNLSIKEQEFIRELNVINITPKQYGYLKGIHERQQRSW